MKKMLILSSILIVIACVYLFLSQKREKSLLSENQAPTASYIDTDKATVNKKDLAAADQMTIDTSLLNDAADINRNCPHMVDKHFRLDSIVALPYNSIRHYYTLVELSKNEIVVEELKNDLGIKSLKALKSSKIMEHWKNKRVNIEYSYCDKNGEFLFELDFTPDMYLQ